MQAGAWALLKKCRFTRICVARGIGSFGQLVALTLVTKQDPQIAKIISGGAGGNRVAQGIEGRVSIERGKRLADRVRASGPLYRAAIHDGARCRTVAVNAVRAGAQNGDAFSGNLFRAGQSKLLIAS